MTISRKNVNKTIICRRRRKEVILFYKTPITADGINIYSLFLQNKTKMSFKAS